MYVESIKYVNLIEIGPVVIEIRGVENGKLAVPVNNTLVRHTVFLAADTQPCVLMLYHKGDCSIKVYRSFTTIFQKCINISIYLFYIIAIMLALSLMCSITHNV